MFRYSFEDLKKKGVELHRRKCTIDAIGAFLMSFIVILCLFYAILCIFNAIFRLFNAILCLFVAKPDFGENLSKKIIESRYIGHFQIIGQIIDIDFILPQIIGDFKELSAKLSISKFEGMLSTNFRYRKI